MPAEIRLFVCVRMRRWNRQERQATYSANNGGLRKTSERTGASPPKHVSRGIPIPLKPLSPRLARRRRLHISYAPAATPQASPFLRRPRSSMLGGSCAEPVASGVSVLMSGRRHPCSATWPPPRMWYLRMSLRGLILAGPWMLVIAPVHTVVILVRAPASPLPCSILRQIV